MPSTIKVRIINAKDLPTMDRKSMLADPFVTIKLGDSKKAQTTIVRKTLNPVWDELFRFEIVNDIALQEEPLELTVYDKDIYTADDAIGSVLIDLNCLLISNSGSGAGCDSISGYFPLYDSFHGIRGHLHVSIKLNFFHDNNPFKDSSAGVQFFSVSTLEGYVIEAIHGFVEELILEKDPECQCAGGAMSAAAYARLSMLTCASAHSCVSVFQITGSTPSAPLARATKLV
jgi:hypothetical protein